MSSPKTYQAIPLLVYLPSAGVDPDAALRQLRASLPKGAVLLAAEDFEDAVVHQQPNEELSARITSVCGSADKVTRQEEPSFKI